MGANQTIRIDVIARANTQQLRKASREIRSLGSAANASAGQAVGGMAVLGKASQAAGTALIAGVGVGLALSAKAAIDFESSFAGVRKTVDASEGQFANLAQTLKDLSLDIPVNVNELARIAELGGQLGVGVGGLEEFTEVIAKLGATTNLEIDEAATSMARFANIMGTSENDFDRVGSTVVDLGNNFATTEHEIFTFGTRLAGIGVTIGATEADILGLAAAFTSLGEPAERGATAVQRTFIAMLSAVDGGGPKLEMFAEIVGVTADEFARMFEEDPTETFIRFERGLDRINDTGGNTTDVLKALGLGSQRTIGLLLKGAAGWEVLDDAVRTANQAYRDNVALDEEAEKRFETTASKIQILANAFRVLAIDIGDKTLGPITEIVEAMKGMLEIFSESTTVVSGFFFAIAGLLAARIFVRLGTGIANLTQSLGNLVNSDAIFFGGMRLGTVFQRLGKFVKGAGGVVGLLAIAFGAYVVIAGQARAKTNRLIEAVERLNEVLSDPDSTTRDRLKAFEETLLGATVTGADSLFSQLADNDAGKANLRETKSILRDYGVAWEDFVDAALDGGLSFNAMVDDVLSQRASLAANAPAFGGGQFGGEGFTGKTAKELGRELTLLTELFDKTRQVFQIGKDLRTEADRESALANPFTLEQELAALRGNANAIAEILEETPEASLLDFISGFVGDDPDGKKARDLLGDFNEVVMEFGEDFQEIWDEIIQDFTDTFTDWEAIWDGYEAVVAPSLTDIRASIAAWRKDSRRLLATQEEIFTEMDHAHRIFWLGLPEAQRRGIAALRAEGGNEWAILLEEMFLEGQQQSLDTLEASLQVLGTVALETIARDWPAKLREAMAVAQEAGFAPGMEQWDTAMDLALEQMIADIALDDPLLAAEMQRFMEAAVDAGFLFDEDLFGAAMDILMADMTTAERSLAFAQMGIAWALDISGGFSAIVALMRGIGGQAGRAASTGFGDALLVKSPSKVFMKIGEHVAEGFRIGMGDMGLGQFDTMLSPSSSSFQENSRTVQVFMEPTGDQADQVQLGLMMGGVTERIEWAGSTSFSGRN